MITMEQLELMTSKQLIDRLADLYIEDYYFYKIGFSQYDGPFKRYLEETAYIERLISAEEAKSANLKAFVVIFGHKPEIKLTRTPAAEMLRFIDRKVNLFEYLMKKARVLGYEFHQAGRMDEVYQIVDEVFGPGNKLLKAEEHQVHQIRYAYLKMKKIYKLGRA